jgi:hypothetical protein
MAETATAPEPVQARPGYCGTHLSERLHHVPGRGGKPICNLCETQRAWERRKYLHANEPHQKYVSCMVCVCLEQERRVMERRAQGLSDFPEMVVPPGPPMYTLTGSALGNVQGPLAVPTPQPRPEPGIMDRPADAPPAPAPMTKPHQVVIKGPEDLAQLTDPK